MQDAKLKQLLSEKEVIGVDLYNLQQELVKVQENIEKSSQSFALVQEEEKRADEILAQIKLNYTNQTSEYQKSKQMVADLQAELDKLYAVAVQVDKEKAEMDAKLAVSKRETSKTEEEATNLEKEKVEQVCWLRVISDDWF